MSKMENFVGGVLFVGYFVGVVFIGDDVGIFNGGSWCISYCDINIILIV